MQKMEQYWLKGVKLLSRAAPWALAVGRREIAPERKLQDFLNAYAYWSYACARVIAENVAEVPVRLFYMKKDGTEEELKDHVALDLLDQVNPWMTSYELRELTQLHMELAGEAWWAFEMNRLGKPGEIWPMLPHWVTILPGGTDAFISGIEYRVPGAAPVSYAPDEVIQFKCAHPTNLYRGWAPARAAALPLDIHQFAQEWLRDFFYNDATPGGVLSTDQFLAPEQANRLRDMWGEAHRGRGKAHRIAVLGQGAKFQLIDRSIHEMALTEESRRLRDDILGIWGVPKAVLGIADDVNRANAESAIYIFQRFLIKPRLQRFQQRLNEFLIARYFDRRLILRFADPVPENREQNLREAETGVKGGFLLVDEARRRIGEPELPGQAGKVLLVPASLIPTKPADLAATAPPPADNGSEKQDTEKGFRRGHTSATRWKVWVRMTEPHERRITAALRRFFQAQEYELLSRLKQHDKEAAFLKRDVDVDAILWDSAEAKAKLTERLGPVLTQVVIDAGERALADLAVDTLFDVENPAVKTGLARQLQRVRGIDDTTRDAVRTELLEGLQAGESIPKLAERVSKVFADATGRRAQTIARTETNGAASLGSEQAWRQSGIVKGKEWVAALDERTRDAHAHADGQRVPLDAPFTVGGESLRYPGDPTGSAENVINCRCALAPVTLTDEE